MLPPKTFMGSPVTIDLDFVGYAIHRPQGKSIPCMDLSEIDSLRVSEKSVRIIGTWNFVR